MKKNIIANFIGKFWSILSNFLFIPVYINYLGIEAYSIISFSLVIAGILIILDTGLTATLSREFAKTIISKDEKNNILRTLESCYFIIVIFIIILMIVFSDYIAFKWLNLNTISPQKVKWYIKIIGVGVGFRLLSKLYMGGLLGLEYQVKANVYQISWGIVRNALVIIVLIFSPTLEVFFIWQSSSTIIYAILLRRSLYKTLNGARSHLFLLPKIDKVVIKSVWKFAGGMLLISFVAALNTQLDKLIISKLFSIENLGYYMLAVSLAHGIVAVINPISVATLPRFTALFTEGNDCKADELFHSLFLPVSILIFSISAVLFVNSEQILWMWTGNISLAEKSSSFVPYITIAFAMLALTILPFNIAIANGNTRLNNYLGIGSLMITLPGYWFATKLMGPIGAAIIFCIAQTLVTFIYLYAINKMYLKSKSLIYIYLKEMLFPALITFTIVWILSFIPVFDNSRILTFIWFSITLVITVVITFIVLIPGRSRILFSRLSKTLSEINFKV